MAHRIAVLLPECNGFIHWEGWVSRQQVEVETRVRFFAVGKNAFLGGEWHAWGFSDVRRIAASGYGFDEIVITSPTVNHELIEEARHRLRSG